MISQSPAGFRTALIAVIVIAAIWILCPKILFGLVLSGSLDPSDYSAFQAVFGMILTVFIALEFKRSLLVVAERRDTVVQIRSVVLSRCLPSAEDHHSRSQGNRYDASPGIGRGDPRVGHRLLADTQ
jgi:hypothetical protein